MWEAHYLTGRTSTHSLSKTSRAIRGVVAADGLHRANAFFYEANQRNPDLYPAEWLTDIRFLGGLGIFVSGFVINRAADFTLSRIRQSSRGEYEIPRGGLFRWVSCPNYLGEMLIWLGWTLATWSPAAAAFFLWTIANLAPRARSHHAWYRERFEDYPQERRALVPGLW
jgi:steroid 5-alpha reductase family enzyme